MEDVKLETQFLRCQLTPDERHDKALLLATKNEELKKAEEEKKDITSRMGQKVKDKRSEVNNLSRVVDDGYEYRFIQCKMSYDYATSEVVTTRTDTGEVIQRRAMTSAEKQMKMNL